MAKPDSTSAVATKPHEHPFAPYVRILGKGKQGSRALSREEACSAMTAILAGHATNAQIGAFLMLLRVKEESAEELAGFVEAARGHIDAPATVSVDLDWSSYAGKGRHLPWFLLAALALADRGLRVFMHGSSGHTAGRLYTEDALTALGIAPSQTWQEVETNLTVTRFAFMPLRTFCAPLQHLIDLRSELGLRSPVHSLVRLLNPLGARHSIQSIFHPPYGPRHQQAAANLGQANAAVFKGEGGEVERKPEANTTVYRICEGELSQMAWPRLVAGRQSQPAGLDPEQLRAVWRGAAADAYGELAVVGTLAIVLELLGRAAQPEEAQWLAREWWNSRDRGCLG